MIKIILKTFFILFFLARTAQSAEFIATVDRNNISINDFMELKLQLIGASDKGYVDLETLKDDFIILGTSQSSSFSMVNGDINSSKAWNIKIRPKKQGEFFIPSFSIQTDQGIFNSNPIKIKVNKGAKQSNSDVRIKTSISKRIAYVNEPIIYKIKVISRVNIYNSNLKIPQSTDFTIEKLGDTKEYKEVKNGIAYHINELTYILTPLKSGRISVKEATLSGETQEASNGKNRLFSRGFSIFSHNEYKPFSISGKKVILNIKPAQTALNEWFPLHSLKIEDEWLDIKNARAGEPINRTITLKALGSHSNQFPDLKYMSSTSDYKIYADKDNNVNEVSKYGLPKSSKSIAYAIIPQKSGKITIPEISIPWWDVNSHKLKYATLPSKEIEVAEADPKLYGNVEKENVNLESIVENQKQFEQEKATNKYLILVIAILSSLLLMAIVYILNLKSKLSASNQRSNPKSKNNKPSSKKLIYEIKSAQSLQSLSKSLRSYAYLELQMPKNSAMEDIKSKLLTIINPKDQKETEELFEQISKSLYMNSKIDLKSCKTKLITILKSAKTKKIKTVKQNTLQLNP